MWTTDQMLLGVICALVLGIFITAIVGAVRSESCEADTSKKPAAGGGGGLPPINAPLVNPYAAGGMQPVRAAAAAAGRT
jgi:hypothetical protein